MADICLFFNVSDSYFLNQYKIYDIGKSNNYFDEGATEHRLNNHAFNSYFEMNKVLLDLISQYGDKVKIVFSITGVTIDLLKKYSPVVLESFVELSKTGNVEFIVDTYYNSLSSLFDEKEFSEQVDMQKQKLIETFGGYTNFFKNTDLLYQDDLSDKIKYLGFDGIYTNGSRKLLNGKSPNYLYKSTKGNLKLLARNYDFSFQLVNLNSDLRVYGLLDLLKEEEGDVVSLSVDYKNIPQENIKFISKFLSQYLKENKMLSITDCMNNLNDIMTLESPELTSVNESKRVNLLLGNRLQQESQREFYSKLSKFKKYLSNDELNNWRIMSSAKYLRFMNLSDEIFKKVDNGDIINPYNKYVYYMNILNDLTLRAQMIEQKIQIETETNNNLSQKEQINNLRNAILE